MDMIFQPSLNSIYELETTGTSFSSKVLKAKLLMAVFDLPAKSSATKTKQFNGEYGCLYCLEKGEVYNEARIFSPTSKLKLRDHSMMEKLASTADETGKTQYGVKGSVSWLSTYKCMNVFQ